MDYSNPLGAKFRAVRESTREGEPVRIVIGERSYSTDVLDLWDAITNIERIPRWFSPITGELKAGGHYQLEGNASGKILQCDPPETLNITWEYAGNISWVTISLTPESSGSRLKLQHTMLKDDSSEAHWEQFGPGATGLGWDLSFLELGLHIASGDTIDRKADEAWMVSDAGKTFMRSCADAWAEAHIADGAAPDIAHAMAQQTFNAYTGN